MFRGLIKLCAALLIFGLVISAWSTGLNGPFLWLLAGTLLWCGGLLVVYLVYRTLKGWLMPSDDTYGSATWATQFDLMRYRVWRPEGICLGQAYGKPVWDNRSRGHTLIIMPTQSGKSSGPVATTLLSQPHSTLIFDIKGELHDEITATYRQTLGPVYRWAPTQRDSCGINPFDWIRWGGDFETGDVQRLAVGLSAPGHEVSDPYWHDAAGAFLTGLLVYAKLEGFNSLGGVYEWLNSGDRDDRLKEMLKSPKDAARKAAQAMLNKSERNAAGVWSQVVTSLSLWADPLVRTNTHHSDIHLHDLQRGAGPVSLYVVIPPGDLQRMKTLCRALVESLAGVMTDQPVSGTHRPKPRHNFVYLSADLSQPFRFIVTPQICICGLFPSGSRVLPLCGGVAGEAGLE